MKSTSRRYFSNSLLLSLPLLMAGCANDTAVAPIAEIAGKDGPITSVIPVPHETGNALAGRDVFRFETFGNEGFWTDAVRLPKGMVDKKFTPMQALQAGLQIDVDALDSDTQQAIATELKTDLSRRNAPLLNDPKTTVMLVEANAVIGMVPKDSNGDGKIDILHGDKVGTSCALCHTMTDGAVVTMESGGSIGHRLDGLANHSLQLGQAFAMAANTRALYPVAQLALKANGGKTLGRAPKGLTEKSTEAEFDAYFSNPDYYPVGMFDDSFDGNGDPMHNSPLFRQDLAFPYGSEGALDTLDNFSNLVYTSLFDMTTLTTPGGRALLHKLAGPAGDELADDYVKILKATRVKGYPYVVASAKSDPDGLSAPVGLRVDNQKLLDMSAYLDKLPAPPGARVDRQMAANGKQLFRTVGCTSCHNVDQGKPVPAFIVPMKTIFPGDDPVELAQRTPPLNPLLDTPGSIFDDKMVVVNASLRGDIRGNAMPLLLDLARKPAFLHDDSVASMDALLDGSRGATAPHPFYIDDAGQRAEMVEFLKSLDTGSN